MLVTDYAVKELAHLPKHIKAENGGAGRGENCKGRNGSDQIFEVKKKKRAEENLLSVTLGWCCME